MKSQVRSALVCLAMVLVLALGFIPTLGITASAADGYTVSYSTPAGVTTPTAETVAAGESVTLPTVEAAKEGYTFVGWTTGVVADTAEKPEILTGTYTPTADVTLYAVFSYGSEAAWTLVTNAADLAVGDSVVIVATKSNYALSTTQNKNNRGQATVTKNDNTVTFGSDVQILTLAAGTKAGTYGFNAGSGYLYAAGGTSNNYLRTGTLADNASFTITIDENGVSTIKASTSGKNWLRYNSSNGLFACYSSGQADVSLYELVGGTTYTTDSCTHAQTDVRTIPATCMTDGATETYCVDCNVVVSSVVIEATGHDYDEGVVTTEPTCTTKGVKTYTCNNGCNQAKTEEIDALGHAYTDGVCSVCGAVDPTAVNYSGRYYIGVQRKEIYYYLTSNLVGSSTLRYEAVATELTQLPTTITAPAANYVFVLEQKPDGTYVISVEGVDFNERYLGYNKKNSGILVAEDEALKVTVDKLESGLYNIHYTASDNERYLALNNSTYNYAAWYGSGSYQDLALIPVVEAEAKTEISDVNVNLGASLAMKYYVTLANGESIADYKLVVTMNGETVTITEYTEKDGKYVFAFTGIAPQCMTDTIKAELVKGDEVVSVKENYSVAQYAKEVIALYPDDAELYALVADMIFYGTAAQLYKEYNVENLASSYLPAGAGQSDLFPSQDGNTPVMDESKNADVFFKAAGVWFDNVNKIYVKFTANAENVTVKANGKELAVESLGGDQYIVYTDGVYATAFDEMVTFELVVDGETVQTLEYSINCYCASKANFETTMGELALALYVYGVSAEAYAAKN